MTPVVLSAAGTSLVVDVAGPGTPRVVHWGADVGELGRRAAAELLKAGALAGPGRSTGPLTVPLLPVESDGWMGRPALSGHRDGAVCHPRLTLSGPVRVVRDPAGGGALTAELADPAAGIEVTGELWLSAQGVLRMRHTVRNAAPGRWTLDGALCLLPVPAAAAEVLDTTGHWARERAPQRIAFGHGLVAHENRRGKTGFDGPPLYVAGTPGFGFRHGEVWGAHVGWSGNHQYVAQRLPELDGVLGGGELVLPGEIRLAAGESYATPWVYFVHSAAGLDGLAGRMHAFLRARPEHPRSPRPLTLNTWEAVYFDHSLDRLTALADRAAAIGVERFVLDDGWFQGRRDDSAGLGDWYVDPEVWPDGLGPLVTHVRRLGMRFGLWVEPEMVNPDSRLARAHPDWVLAAPGRTPAPVRNQQVLDVARPEVFDYLLGRLDALVADYEIDYLKWDHNRHLVEAVHDGAAGVHAQTAAAYRLVDELRRRHPDLEIESCAGGGGRVDLGVLARTDRIWTSDNNDPYERQQIQRWTWQLVPPELTGCHVGPPVSHTNGRATRLRFRCLTALFGHAGIEWDITTCTAEELAELADWVGAYRRLRGLLHAGRTVRADHPDPAAYLYGVVAADGGHAVFAYAQLASSAAFGPVRLRLPGLTPDARYTVALCPELPPPVQRGVPWRPDLTLTGAALAAHGVAAPMLTPGDGYVLELHREETS
jgi:alpha-galactosidase